MKQKFVFLASIAAGLLAAALSYAWLKSKNAEYDRAYSEFRKGKVKVVMSYPALPSGTTLELSDIGIGSINADAVTDDHILEADYQRIIGRKLVHSLGARTPILWPFLDGGRQRSRTLSDEVQPGMRAVSIPVSGASGVSGMLRPNDSVDVLGSFVLPAAEQNGISEEMEVVTLTVLQNVTILAVGDKTMRGLDPARNASSYGTVTLHVTPREAEVLVFAQQMKGKLFLTLRNPTDIYFENEMPRIDFNKIESELQSLNDNRQFKIRNIRRAAPIKQ